LSLWGCLTVKQLMSRILVKSPMVNQI